MFMKKLFFVLSFIFVIVFPLHLRAQEEVKVQKEQETREVQKEIIVPPGGARLRYEVYENGDTVFVAQLRDVWVFPKMKFKNKKQEQFYWRTVRDVKKTLPYAKLLSKELIETNQKLASLPNDKARKEYLNAYEKELFKKYESQLKKFTMSQGKMLIKLVDRETEQTSYDLIKIYRGSVSAVFWQGVARIFGANLKTQFSSGKDEDAIIERVILLVESEQL
jgi:hypothetical protein